MASAGSDDDHRGDQEPHPSLSYLDPFVDSAGPSLNSPPTPMASYLFSSESVTEGHPDKLCDAVSDSILDACLAADPHSRVACETVAKTGFVLVAGEITTKAQLDFQR